MSNIIRRANDYIQMYIIVVLKTHNLQNGYYFYFIYKLKIRAARGGNTLEMVLLDVNLNEAAESDVTEEILGEMVEKGIRLKSIRIT